MHKKIGLWIAVTLATVLGVGCGGGETSPAATKTREEKINEVLNDPEVKEKKEKLINLVIDQYTQRGFSGENVKGCRSVLEEGLEFVVVGMVQAYEEHTPNGATTTAPSEEDIETEKRKLNLMMSSLKNEWQFAMSGIRNRQDLERVLRSGSATPEQHIKIMSTLNRLGISSDKDIVSLRDMLLDDRFIDSCIDLISTVAQQIQKV